MLLGYLVKGYVIFAFYLQLLFNIFILCHVFRTETLISFPCTSRKSRVLKSSGKGYALKSFLRNQSCNVLCTPSMSSQWHSAKLCSHLSCWSCGGRASTGLRKMRWKLPRGISDCENCLSKGFFAFPGEHAQSFVKCLSQCLILLKIELIFEILYPDWSCIYRYTCTLVFLQQPCYICLLILKGYVEILLDFQHAQSYPLWERAEFCAVWNMLSFFPFSHFTTLDRASQYSVNRSGNSGPSFSSLC